MRRMMQADPDIYINYFQGLISSSVRITGDITPSYSVIDQTSLKKIFHYLHNGGFDVKVIFLMRDPIERLWSAVRMVQRNRIRSGQQLDENFCNIHVLKFMEDAGQVARSDYMSIVQNIEAVFPENDIHFEVYENLFNKSSVERLSSFLGYSLESVDLLKKVNSSPDSPRLESTTSKMAEFLAPQYGFCKSKFPITRDLWADVG